MPQEINTLKSISELIMTLLNDQYTLAFNCQEIAIELNLAPSTIRKHCKQLYEMRYIERGRNKHNNKAFYYYIKGEETEE